MNFVIKTRRLPPGKRPIHLQELGRILPILEVKPQTSSNDGCFVYALNRAPDSTLWDYLEQARKNHRRLICQHHPDRGGSTETAAILNACFTRAIELFRRRGFTLG